MTSPITFLQEVRAELLKVVWPTKTEAIRLTTVVIAVSVIVGFYIGGLDFVFAKVAEIVLKK